MKSLLLTVLLAVCAATAATQQPADRRIDSLQAELRILRARLDSLLRRDTATGALAQLRARAQAAAQRGTQPDTGGARQVAGARNLNQLNPEISVTADLRGAVQTAGPQTDNVELHEMEFSFQAALDPYSHTKLFAALHEGEIEMEEAYFYYTGLPGRLRLDVGVFRQQLGELNRWHLHALPEADYPLALTTYAGEEGLAAAGLSAYWHASLLGTQELWAQVSMGANERLFEDGNRPAFLFHLNNFWQLARATYVQLGVTGVYGTNPDADLTTRLGGLDARLTWRPPARAKYREWNVRGELYAIEKRRGGAADVRYGWYLGTNYKLGQRWIVGARYDYVEAPEGLLAIVRQVVPSLTFWQSEWVKLHAEWQHRREAGATDNLIVLQAVWSIGPHKHEIY